MPKGILEFKIKKEWFDMIKSGKKKEEYREIKPFYTSRFKNEYARNNPDAELYDFELVEDMIRQEYTVKFVNGYQTNAPYIVRKCLLRVGQGREEWGAIPGQEYYILEILEVSK